MEPPPAGLKAPCLSNCPRRLTDSGILPNVRGPITTHLLAAVGYELVISTLMLGSSEMI